MEYHTSIFYDEISFDWSKIEFKYQDEPIFFIYYTGPFAW